MNYNKRVKINAPQEIIWRHVSSMKGMESWSPWNKYEPDMDKEWSRTSESVCDKMTQEGTNEKVSAGSQTITKLDALDRIDTDIHFLKPQEDTLQGFVELSRADGGTNADGVSTQIWVSQ